MSSCGTTHYEGCECNEARWQRRLSVEHNEVLKLREELKLSEARRAELLIFATNIRDDIQLTYRDNPMTSAPKFWFEQANKTLASQPRPKILDVLEAALKRPHERYCAIYTREHKCDCELNKVLAAMKEE